MKLSFVILIFAILKGEGQKLERSNVHDRYFRISKLQILK